MTLHNWFSRAKTYGHPLTGVQELNPHSETVEAHEMSALRELADKVAAARGVVGSRTQFQL